MSASPVLNPTVLLGLVSLLLRLKGQRNGFSLVFTARLDSGTGGIGLLRLRLCVCMCENMFVYELEGRGEVD